MCWYGRQEQCVNTPWIAQNAPVKLAEKTMGPGKDENQHKPIQTVGEGREGASQSERMGGIRGWVPLC